LPASVAIDSGPLRAAFPTDGYHCCDSWQSTPAGPQDACPPELL